MSSLKNRIDEIKANPENKEYLRGNLTEPKENIQIEENKQNFHEISENEFKKGHSDEILTHKTNQSKSYLKLVI